MESERTKQQGSPQDDCIERLIRAYFDGRTTRQEEAELRAFFASNAAREKYQDIAPLFLLVPDLLCSAEPEPLVEISPNRQRSLWAKRIGLSIGVAAALAIALIPNFRKSKVSAPDSEYLAPRYSYVIVGGKQIQSDALASKYADQAFDAVSTTDDGILDMILPSSN